MLGARTLTAEGSPQLLFMENETNSASLFGAMASGRYVKDGINDFVVHGRLDAVNPADEGTKASARYHVVVNPGETFVIKLRLSDVDRPTAACGSRFRSRVRRRGIDEADEFYASIIPVALGRRRARRDAPGDCRAAVVEAVLPLRRARMARRAIPHRLRRRPNV